MAYDRAVIYVAATSAEQTAYAGTNRLKTFNNTVYLSFPMRFVAFNGVHIEPNVREEIKAIRDENTRRLTRVTADGMKTSISIDILGGLHNEDRKTVIGWFTAHETSAKERKVPLLYYDMDADTYETGDFYRANATWDWLYQTDNDIIWDAFTIELVEY